MSFAKRRIFEETDYEDKHWKRIEKRTGKFYDDYVSCEMLEKEMFKE